MKNINAQFIALSLSLFFAGESDVMAERLEQASISDSPWTFNAYIDGWLPKAPVDIVGQKIHYIFTLRRHFQHG